MSLEECPATKTVTKTGNGAHVVVPKALLGETVKVVYPADDETGSNSMEETLWDLECLQAITNGTGATGGDRTATAAR